MPDIKLKTVLAWFWKYTRPTKGMFFSYIGIFFLAYGLEAIIPLAYKNFFNTIANGEGSVEQRVPVLIGIIGTVGVLLFIRWSLFRIAGLLIIRQELATKQAMDEGLSLIHI